MQLKKIQNKLTRIVLFVFSISFCYQAQAQINVLWESRFTSAGLNADRGKEIAIDSSGNVYVIGTSYTSAGNGFDIVTIKYDPLGTQLWATSFNGAGNGLDEGRDIALDKNGNVYITGYSATTSSNYDIVTIKYNSTGTQQWANIYNGTGNGFDEAYAITTDTLNNIYIAGGTDVSSQGSNFITIKYNSAGTQQWLSTYNGPGNSIDAATQISLDAQFNVYITGQSTGSGTDLDFATIKYNNTGTQQWIRRFDGALSFFDVPEGIYVDNLNNVYVTGASYGGLATLNDYATVKYNSSGTQQWAKILDGPLNDEDKAFDVVVDLNQNVYVTGRSMGLNGTAQNILTIKYDASGNISWQDTYDGPASGYDDGEQMRLGASGSLYITGYSAGNGTNNDYLTLKYDTTNGSILWEARFNGPSSNNDQAFAMEIDALENIYVVGTSKDPVSGQDFSTIKWCQLTTNAGSDVAICLGNNIQLNANALGATGYLWTPSTGLSDNTAPNPTANPTTTTTYIVSATNALGCVDFDTIIVTVNPLPANTITASGPTTFCMGDSVVLTATNPGSYNWSPTSDTTQSITIFSSGNYSVVITDSNSCNNTGNQAVTVNTLPNVTAGSDANLCNGDSLILNASGALTYTWNTQSTLSDSTIANPFAFPTVATNYWVTGTDANGCSKSDTLLIAISISPVANISNSSTNDTLDLNLPNGGDIQFFSNLTTNATGFSWDFGDTGSSSAANPIYTYTGGGDYTVMFIASNGGCSDTVYVNITVLQVISVKENSLANKIIIYPNPAKNIASIQFKDMIPQNSSFTIYNSIGDVIEKFNYEIRNNSTLKLNISEYSNGLYFMEMDINSEKITKRFSVIK